MVQLVGKRLEIPARGWTVAEFVRQGVLLQRTMVRLARLTQARAIPPMAKEVSRLFTNQMEEVIRRVLRRAQPKAATISGEVSSKVSLVTNNEALWIQAIEEVFAERGIPLTAEIIPPVQSVMAQGYSKIGALMNQPANPDTNPRLLREAQKIAERVTQINETTRNVLRGTIQESVASGAGVAETVDAIRDRVPDINARRSVTIARTELSNAWTRGAAASFLESKVITELSVIGCQSREEERWGEPSYPWMWRGESTCGARGIPLGELERVVEIGWHPNHTGTLVASAFRS